MNMVAGYSGMSPNSTVVLIVRHNYDVHDVDIDCNSQHLEVLLKTIFYISWFLCSQSNQRAALYSPIPGSL